MFINLKAVSCGHMSFGSSYMDIVLSVGEIIYYHQNSYNGDPDLRDTTRIVLRGEYLYVIESVEYISKLIDDASTSTNKP